LTELPRKIKRTISSSLPSRGNRSTSSYLYLLSLVLPDDVVLVALGCKEFFIHGVSSCGREFFQPLGCGLRRYCSSCAEAARRFRTDRVMDILKRAYIAAGFEFQDMRAFMVTFTMPKDVALRVRPSDYDWLRSVAGSLLSDLYVRKFVSSETIVNGSHRRLRFEMGSLDAVQFWHSSHVGRGDLGNAFRGLNLHVHCLRVNLVFDLLERKWVRIPVGMMTPQHLSEFRVELMSEFARLVEARCGPSKFNPEGKVGKAGEVSSWNMEYSYYKSYYEVQKSVRYVARTFVFDASQDVRAGYFPKASEIAWFKLAIDYKPKGGKVIAAGGWLGASVVNRRCKVIGIRIPSVSEFRKSRAECVCPFCGDIVAWDGWKNAVHRDDVKRRMDLEPDRLFVLGSGR
jgi:hypothetical protein